MTMPNRVLLALLVVISLALLLNACQTIPPAYPATQSSDDTHTSPDAEQTMQRTPEPTRPSALMVALTPIDTIPERTSSVLTSTSWLPQHISHTLVLSPLVYPANTVVAGVDVSGLSLVQATEKLRAELAIVKEPLVITVGKKTLTLTAETLGLRVLIGQMLLDAYRQIEHQPVSDQPPQGIDIPLNISFDELEMRRQLELFARQTKVAPSLRVMTETIPISGSFVLDKHYYAPVFAYVPGYKLDVAYAVDRIKRRLRSPESSHQLALTLHKDPASPVPHPSLKQIRQQVQRLTRQWNDGVIGFALYDLQIGKQIAVNGETIFSGASVMKTAILLHAYVTLPYLTEQQQQWIDLMIRESNNIAANNVLAASMGGFSEYDAFAGARHMSGMLHTLGLEHSYQSGPYTITPPEMAGAAYSFLYPMPFAEDPPAEPVLYDIDPVAWENPAYTPPSENNVTNADYFLRTTPADISQMFVLIEQCHNGQGALLDRFSQTLSAERCAEILDVLAQNEDTKRMRAGLPAGIRVEHKSGWLDDMQADAGIVRTQGGDFVLAIFVYRDVFYLEDSVAHPIIAALARLSYTAYNPIKLSGGL
jgi:hypothetical protein